MIRSVLRLTPEELNRIKLALPSITDKQRETQKNFAITSTERSILKELVALLESFEFVTNQMQGDGVSISKVYSCYLFLTTFLQPDTTKFKHTSLLRKQLLKSLKKRYYSFNFFIIFDNKLVLKFQKILIC